MITKNQSSITKNQSSITKKQSPTNKILFSILLILVILPIISAVRYEDNVFRYGEIEPSGTLIPTSTPINNVGV